MWSLFVPRWPHKPQVYTTIFAANCPETFWRKFRLTTEVHNATKTVVNPKKHTSCVNGAETTPTSSTMEWRDRGQRSPLAGTHMMWLKFIVRWISCIVICAPPPIDTTLSVELSHILWWHADSFCHGNSSSIQEFDNLGGINMHVHYDNRTFWESHKNYKSTSMKTEFGRN